MTKGRLLRRVIEEVYGPGEAAGFWKRLDVIGDIAFIRVPFGRSPEELRPLAEAIVERVPYVRSVWAIVSPVEGEYRLRGRFVHLAGERRTETVYREHGCSFRVDVARVYVSPRLNYEHERVARLVADGETVVNMYAGAGLFSIVMACMHRGRVKVYSVDINPYAYAYMVENVRINRVEGSVVPILADAVEAVERLLYETATRVLMPLPEKALEHLPYALRALRGGRGWLHVYLHVATPRGVDPRRAGVEAVVERLRGLGYRAVEAAARVVRTVGPRRSQVVVDVRVEPLEG